MLDRRLCVLDLPRGFSYRIISRFGDRMDDGHFVPSNADGMGAFRLDLGPRIYRSVGQRQTGLVQMV